MPLCCVCLLLYKIIKALQLLESINDQCPNAGSLVAGAVRWLQEGAWSRPQYSPLSQCRVSPVASGLHLCSSSTPGTGAADGPSLLTPPTPAHCLGLIGEKVSSQCYHQVTNPLQLQRNLNGNINMYFCMIYFICCFEKGCCFDQNWIWLHNSYLYSQYSWFYFSCMVFCVCVDIMSILYFHVTVNFFSS